jgi:two-component system, OmpR family, phosphate regulon sensor histidine kinase PhoR
MTIYNKYKHMKSTLHRILTALIVIVLLPLLIFVFYEYSKLNEQEQIIGQVYKNQLESLVSSLNSYTQDVAANWAMRLESSIKYNKAASQAEMLRLTTENPSLLSIHLVHQNNKIDAYYKLANARVNIDTIKRHLPGLSKTILQLSAYYKSNYRKISALPASDNRHLIYFMAEDANGKLLTCFFEIDNQAFLTDMLQSRIQSMARDNFAITILDSSLNQIMVSSNKQSNLPLQADLVGSLWLMPQMKINISLKSETIDQLVKGRIQSAVIMFSLILVILLIGIWFLYASIRRQIQLTQIKSEFIANVSHEIRTPLALISMYIETLEMGRVKSADKVQEYYQIITHETHRLTAMVNKILNFSKMENGKRQFKMGVADANTIVQKVIDTYNVHFENSGFKCYFIPDNHLPQIFCDPEAITEALINLIDNAIKYSAGNKVVELHTGTYRQGVYVEVKDYGVGIAKKHHKLVFDKFYRVTTGNLANKVKGTGLGLAIVNEIMKGHKGKITLTSKLNEGSTFKLWFPINTNHSKTE